MFEKIWKSLGRWRILLLPFSWLFGAILAIRHWLFDKHILWSASFSVPVISVGNISVGGTGKTPVIQYVNALLLKQGFKTGILSRGYGRSSKGFMTVRPESTASVVGDEPWLHAHYFPQTCVAVCEDRAVGISELLAEQAEVQIVLLDDAFQHRWVKPHVHILLSDFNQPFYKDYLLPAGRNRDLVKAAKRAHYLIFTRTPAGVDEQMMHAVESEAQKYLNEHAKIYFTTMTPSAWQSFTQFEVPPLCGKNAIAFAGLANNNAFYDSIESTINVVKTVSYADHHAYGIHDLKYLASLLQKAGSDGILLTTDKDAAKLRHLPEAQQLLGDKLFYRGIKIAFLRHEAQFETQLIQDIENIIKSTD